MTTTNTDKKALIQKLIEDKVIDIDQALMLLETEKEYIASPYPVYPSYPYYQGPWWGICPPAYWPYTGTISTGDLTLTLSGSCTTTVCSGDVTSTDYSITRAGAYPGSYVSYTAN